MIIFAIDCAERSMPPMKMANVRPIASSSVSATRNIPTPSFYMSRIIS